MKKISYLLGLLAVAGVLFTSCAKDEEEPLPPTITFLGGVHPGTGWDRVDGDVTLEVGEPFVFGFTAQSKSDKNLSTIKVTRDYENVSQTTVLDSAVSVSSFTVDIETIAFPNNPGSEVFTIKVTDKNGLSTSASFTITTVPGDPGISSYTNITLGSYTSATNSSFASITGETFSMTEAQDADVQAKIDWVYFHGATYGHTVMSPTNNNLYAVYPQIENWTNKNNTLFAKTALNQAAYDLVTDKNILILTIQNTGVTLNSNFFSELISNPGGFAVGDVLAFETHTGNRGLLIIKEVNSASPNGNSTIKYDIKVENPPK
ncbi:MAG: hypothetical protein K9H49_02285 [Bacteroidales bacterium]|nr:hypothetical protein [Bacteroidales bacterium]MCF8403397.1 hypothetical protein [Bacteroidales bacterium]